MEMKFRAKYHGEVALHLGLTPEQLLLVEQYVEGLKHGTIEEARIVDQLMKRVRGRRVGCYSFKFCSCFAMRLPALLLVFPAPLPGGWPE